MPTTDKAIQALDLDRLLRLRLVVARVGELGLAGWWGTKDVLGAMGAMAYRRGFPRSHPWARAKVVFEVARVRCQERFPDPTAITLWSLPASVEEQFEHAWNKWVGDDDAWPHFFTQLQEWKSPALMDALKSFSLWTPAMETCLADVGRVESSFEVHALGQLDDLKVGLLAAAFAKGATGELVVPFLRLEGA